MSALVASALVMMAGSLGALPAQANHCGTDIICGIIAAAMAADAQKKWAAVDPEVRQCLIREYRFKFEVLIHNGVGPNHKEVAPYVRDCQQRVDQGRAAIENAKNKWLAVDRDVQECLSRDYDIQPTQLAQAGVGPDDDRIAPYVQACRQSLEEAVAAVKAAEKRHKELVAKCGEDFAIAIEQGRVLVGMTKDCVLEGRGEPDSKDLIPPDDELWVYGSDRIVLNAGKVTYIGR